MFKAGSRVRVAVSTDKIMAMLLDSTAVFEEKVLGLGFDQAQLEGLQKQGIKTIGDAAFVVQLEATDASEQMNKLAGKVFGADPLPGDLAKLRRLLTMSNTMAAVEFRRVSEDNEGCKNAQGRKGDQAGGSKEETWGSDHKWLQ